MNLFYIFIFLNLLNEIFNDNVVPCLAAQECQYAGNIIPCSEHGICFYDIFKYVSEDSTNTNFIDCICDEGYITKGEDSVKCCYEQKVSLRISEHISLDDKMCLYTCGHPPFPIPAFHH